MSVVPTSGSRRRAAPVAAVLGAIALAACGTGGASTGATAAGQTRSSAATVSTTTVTTTATAAPTSSQTGPAPCRAAGLALRFLGQQGATGHGEIGFAVRNTGSAPCRTYGFPGVQFLSASGGQLPTHAQRSTNDFVGPAPVAEIILAPGASASFRIGVTHGNASPTGCTTAQGLQVYPPDDTATLSTTIPGGAYECATATVSPMRPGTSAYR